MAASSSAELCRATGDAGVLFGVTAYFWGAELQKFELCGGFWVCRSICRKEMKQDKLNKCQKHGKDQVKRGQS